MSGISSVQSNAATAGVANDLDLGPTDGIQLRFAKLLLKLSNASKLQADDYMKQVEGIQGKQKEAAAMIEEARAQINKFNDPKYVEFSMSPEMKQYFEDEKLKLGTITKMTTTVESTSCSETATQITMGNTPRAVFTKEQWEFNLKSLTNHQEQLGTKTQSLMVFLQDFVGQYNANLTGAKTAIADFNDTLKTLMR
ncbi:MAG: hypothetical protein RRY20_04210 [Bilophila sp.]